MKLTIKEMLELKERLIDGVNEDVDRCFGSLSLTERIAVIKMLDSQLSNSSSSEFAETSSYDRQVGNVINTREL